MNLTHYIEEQVAQFSDPKSSDYKYLVLRNLLKNLIQKNPLLHGSKMPSTRKLADLLSISRSSVNKTYELLVYEGLIEPKHGSGYLISKQQTTKKDIQTTKQSNTLYPKISTFGESFLSNVHLMGKKESSAIAFRPGLPPLDIFPIDRWKKLANSYWRNVRSASLNYSDASGLNMLKQQIAEYLYYLRGLSCDAEQIIIVSGSVQSLFLIGSAILDPGDTILLENPTFPNVKTIFKSLRSNVMTLPIDLEGIAIHQFADVTHPKLIHITPSNHYPTGVKMSLARKKQVIEWANKNNSLIIENDYDHEISNWGNKEPSVYELDQYDRTIFLGTFNRLLHPSIRLGYMVVPYYLLDVIQAIQKQSHRFVSPSNQIMMGEFIRKDYLLHHIKNVIEVNEERKELFVNYLKENLNSNFQLVDHGTRSLHSLIQVSGNFTDEDLLTSLDSKNIIAHNYSQCFIHNPLQGLIFGHVAVNKHLMQPMLKKLADTLHKFKL